MVECTEKIPKCSMHYADIKILLLILRNTCKNVFVFETGKRQLCMH